MAEAEDVITDVARHATVFAQDLWRRHRSAPRGPQPVRFTDVAERLNLLLTAVFGRSFALRVAQAPAPPTFLSKIFLRRQGPSVREAVPATDGFSIWLPNVFGMSEPAPKAVERFRTMALQQAMRAVRGSAAHQPCDGPPMLRDLYLLLEGHAADQALLQALPGMAAALSNLRRDALGRRPPPSAFPGPQRQLDALARAVLDTAPGQAIKMQGWPALDKTVSGLPVEPAQVLELARALLRDVKATNPSAAAGGCWLWRDWWTGDLRSPPRTTQVAAGGAAQHIPHESLGSPRNARLARRPEVREGEEDQEHTQPGAWMVQTAQPHEMAEDPMGLQRPADRDVVTAAEEFADALSEMPKAQLVSTLGRPKEVLLSDDPLPSRMKRERLAEAGNPPGRLHYPEWDWRAGVYRNPGATVLLLPASDGPQQWVEDTLRERRGMLQEIRRRFEMLRAQRQRVHRQFDGHDLDLSAFVEAQADYRAGLPMAQRLYQNERRSRRDMAIMLLVDVSGSTDGWISAGRRVIDVEREALLLVCIALEGLDTAYSVQAFSGEGANAVVVRSVKRFDERYGVQVAQRIAGLEPEHYTRAGAALRHASSLLMHEPAAHRLLLLLSDGKPNDVDDYEGRYGVEDMRQAVTEAKLQGISPFCLTIDRQAANYLPAVFGSHQYALLPRPELLPTVLLDWLRRLVAT